MNPPLAPTALPGHLPSCDVAVVGAANMDIMVHTATGLAASDSNPGRILCAPGGVGRNVAENLARLGLRTRLFSVVGDDVFGQALLMATRQAGVDVSPVRVVGGASSPSYLAWHGADGDMLAAVNAMGLLDQLTPDALREQGYPPAQARMLVLDCNLLPSVFESVLETASAPVFVDAVSVVKCEKVRPWLHRIHLLKMNQREASVLSGQPIHAVGDALQAARTLHQAGVRQVVISLGAQGACWCDEQGRTGHRPATPVEVVNTAGAGDALLAGLVLGCALD
ncbi:MAG: kinase, partial [Rhodoferax sp.]|nr:kinase [Rhodoferax sp.]